MKNTGMTRPMDPLGRLVLPIELRRNLEITEGDLIQIYVEEDKIILKKYEVSCIFCGSAKDVKEIKDKCICKKCLNELK